MSLVTDSTVLIDLSDVSTLIGEAVATLRALDGMRVAQGNNATRADAKRDLIYLSNTLSRAASEAQAVYHVVNGKPDPLEVR